MRRFLMLTAVSAAFSCGPTVVQDNQLLLTLRPDPLWDDGAIGSVVITTSDKYGNAGTGHVTVQATAGSLHTPLEVTLDELGSVTVQMTCIAVEDPSCIGTVPVTATWAAIDGPLAVTKPLTIHSTDALVSACAFSNRRDLDVLAGAQPRLKLALLDTPPEMTPIGPTGIGVYDSASNTGGLAVSIATLTSDPTAEELRVRNLIGSARNPLVQTFTTWDGHAAARSTFDVDTDVSLKAFLDQASGAFTGLPTGLTANPILGPFKVELTVVLHDDGQTAVVLAVASTAGFTDAIAFRLDDLAGGSALALSTDALADNCESFTIDDIGKKVDFVWVVDDSCSMATSQHAVAAVGEAAIARIKGSGIDFRAAGVSTGDYAPYYLGSFRNWTSDLTQMLGWFMGAHAWGVAGNGIESGFSGLRAFIEGNAVDGDAPMPGPFRAGSEVHIIFMSDTKDQSVYSAQDMFTYLHDQFPRRHFVVHGILCPEGHECGDEPEDAVGKYHTLIRMTGGVLGSILVFNPTDVTPTLAAQQATTMAAIVRSVLNSAGFSLLHNPITASVRVATSATVGKCNNADIPRDNENGWDLDPTSNKVSFSGACVPQAGSLAVVSYQSWVRNGTVVHNQGQTVYAVGVTPPDAGASDAGTADAGTTDAGATDAGCDGGGC